MILVVAYWVNNWSYHYDFLIQFNLLFYYITFIKVNHRFCMSFFSLQNKGNLTLLILMVMISILTVLFPLPRRLDVVILLVEYWVNKWSSHYVFLIEFNLLYHFLKGEAIGFACRSSLQNRGDFTLLVLVVMISILTIIFPLPRRTRMNRQEAPGQSSLSVSFGCCCSRREQPLLVITKS